MLGTPTEAASIQGAGRADEAVLVEAARSVVLKGRGHVDDVGARGQG